jgi:hypothetical protein
VEICKPRGIQVIREIHKEICPPCLGNDDSNCVVVRCSEARKWRTVFFF